MTHRRSGFTLIELLITLSIVAIIAGAVFVAVNPQKRLEFARNSRRLTDLTVTMDALKAFQSTHDGTMTTAASDTPPNVKIVDDDPSTIQIIGKNIFSGSSITPPTCAQYQATLPCRDLVLPATNCSVNWLSSVAAEETQGLSMTALRPYLAKVPSDPQRKGADGRNDSRYFVNYYPDSGTVLVGSCEGSDPNGDPDQPSAPMTIMQ